MPNATFTLPAADRDAAGNDDDLGLPGWLYRSEAFPEDLDASDPATPVAGPALRRLLTSLLYPATLVVAVLATLPSALTVA